MDTSALEIAARGVVPPATVAAIFLIAAWKPWRGSGVGGGPASAWGPPLALGLGYAAGHVATHGWPPFALQVGVKQGLFYVAVAAAILGLFEALRRPTWWFRAGVAIGLPLYLLDFMREHHWSGAESLGWTAGLAALLFGSWSGLEQLARREPGPGLSLAWTACAAATSLALLFAGTASVAQLAGGLATGLGVAAVVGLRRPQASLAPGGTTCLALLYAGLLWAGHYSAELTGLATILLGVAPLAPALVALPGARSVRGRRRGLLRVGLALVPALIAVALEFVDRPPPSPY